MSPHIARPAVLGILAAAGLVSGRAAADTVWFAERAVNVRTTPALSGDVRFTLGVNTKVVRDRIDGEWWHLRSPVAGWSRGDAFSRTLDWSAGGVGGQYAQRSVNLRSRPAVDGEVRATFGVNSAIHFDGSVRQGENPRWVHATYPMSGWMQAEALGRNPLWTTSHVGSRYAKSTLNLRAGPGTNYPARSQVSRNVRVEVDAYVQDRGGWSHLKSPRSGWVYARYLTTTPPYSLVWPVSGRVASTWRYRTLSINGGFHGAVDIGGNSGAAAGAARNGTVETSSYGYNGGYGNCVRIGHGNGWTTDYHHFRSGGLAVRAGQPVSTLQTVGYVGDTGLTTGPHLHFDLRRYGTKTFMSAVTGQYLTKGRPVPNRYSGL